MKLRPKDNLQSSSIKNLLNQIEKSQQQVKNFNEESLPMFTKLDKIRGSDFARFTTPTPIGNDQRP